MIFFLDERVDSGGRGEKRADYQRRTRPRGPRGPRGRKGEIAV